MDFSLSDEQVIFRNMAREFAERHIEPIAKDSDHQERFPEEVLKEMAPLGLLGLTVPQDYGGLGLDYVGYAIVTEEVARSSLSVAISVFGTHSVVQEMLVAWGSEEQKKKYLPPMCKGELLSSCALAEAGTGFNVSAIKSKAELQKDPQGKGWWVLNGEKVSVTNGGVAKLSLVFARSDGDAQGISAFLVGRDAPGLSSTDISAKQGLRSCNIANFSLKDCRISQENLLGSTGDGTRIAESLLAMVNLGIAAGCLGVAQASIDAGVKYAEERSVFGRTISNYDMIQATIADMIVGTEAARLLTYRAAELKSKRQPFSRQLAMARYLASKVALHAATHAIQVHGAYGFGKEYNVERYLRDVVEASLYGGVPSHYKLAVARSAFGIGA